MKPPAVKPARRAAGAGGRSARWRSLLAAVAVLLLGGCGISAQSHAQRLSSRHVPFGLLSPAPGTGGKHGQPATEAVILYMLDKSGHLVAVGRQLPVPASLDARLQALAAAPTPGEAAAGLASAVSVPGSSPTGVRAGSRVIINLTPGFEHLATRVQVDALAQLVYTATAIPGVGAVSFRVNDHVVAVPRANNTATSSPVTRADYRPLAPRASV